MKRLISTILVAVVNISAAIVLKAGQYDAYIASPRGETAVLVFTQDGKAYYQVEHHSDPFISTSRLGLRTNAFDFSELVDDAVDAAGEGREGLHFGSQSLQVRVLA